MFDDVDVYVCVGRRNYFVNCFTNKGSGGNEKLPPRSFSTLGIVLGTTNIMLE